MRQPLHIALLTGLLCFLCACSKRVNESSDPSEPPPVGTIGTNFVDPKAVRAACELTQTNETDYQLVCHPVTTSSDGIVHRITEIPANLSLTWETPTLVSDEADVESADCVAERTGLVQVCRIVMTRSVTDVAMKVDLVMKNEAATKGNPDADKVPSTIASTVVVPKAPTPSASPSPSLSPSPSPSPHASPSASPSPSPHASPSASPSPSPHASPSASPSPSPHASPSASPSPSPHASPSASPSPSPHASPSVSPCPHH